MATISVTRPRWLFWLALMLVTIGLDACQLGGPSRQDSPSLTTADTPRWAPIELALPQGPSIGTAAGVGVTGLLVGGGSDQGPWLNLVAGSHGRAVAVKALATLPKGATVAGITPFEASVLVLFASGTSGASTRGDGPIQIAASTDDATWTFVTHVGIGPSVAPEGIVATSGVAAMVGSTRSEPSAPGSGSGSGLSPTDLVLYLSHGSSDWARISDPVFRVGSRTGYSLQGALHPSTSSLRPNSSRTPRRRSC